jgi:glyoxylase-like metal-dependent hydrolase (beta-lactamase superfamily II)
MEYNAGAFISNGEAALIDPGVHLDEMEALARLAAGQGAAPRWIILTHSHWDHIFGPEHFPGVPIIAQARYLKEVEANADGIRTEIAKWEKRFGPRRDAPFVIPRPTETVDDEATITVGGLSLRLTHVPGHASDQLAVYHAESQTFWASDILSDVEIPFVSHSLAAYEATLTRLADWAIRVLVPGHGHATTDLADIRTRLTDDRAYLAELRARVTRAVRDEKTVEETVASCADMRYHHPEENEFYHRLNAESAYLELGGEADPKRVGWNQDWSLKDD